MKKNPLLMRLFAVGRHYNISQVVLMQRFKSILDATLRDQFTILCLGRLAGKKTTEELLDDLDELPGDHRTTRK